jgi:hypothetical protein
VGYERKYPLRGVEPEQVLARLRLHPAAFRPLHAERWVRSLYLDTPGRSSLVEHEAGAPDRQKLRVRWYGAATGEVAGAQLELKQRRGAVRRKVGFPLGPFALDAAGGLAPLLAAVARAPLPTAVRELVAACQPVLVTAYRRCYLLGAGVRATIDRDLAFHLVRSLRPGVGSRVDDVVLELKYDVEQEADAAQIAAALPFRRGKFSKYVEGARLLGVYRM